MVSRLKALLAVTGKLGAAYMLADVNIKNGAALMVRVGDDCYEPNYGVSVSLRCSTT